MRIPRPIVLGFLIGSGLGMADYFVLRALDVVMTVDGRDVTLMVVTFFALNFGALGAVIARLWEQRRNLQAQSELIQNQFEDIRRVQDALVESETLAAVGRMSAGVAHEVRNPLSVIRSSAQILAADLEGAAANAATFICEEVDRLDGFVSRVLELSRRVDVETEPTKWTELRERLQAAVEATVEFDGQVTGYDVDAELTVRVLANLIDNARQSEATRVCVRAADGAIEVVDDGPGIKPEDRDRIFEPFFTTRTKGTGLGLSMARKLARVQGWDLELADGGLGPAGRGARFRFVRRPDRVPA